MVKSNFWVKRLINSIIYLKYNTFSAMVLIFATIGFIYILKLRGGDALIAALVIYIIQKATSYLITKYA